MATIVHEGNGRFRFITDAEEVGASGTFVPTVTLAPPAPPSAPPLQPPYPNTNPNYGEKRQAARSGGMTSTATADLYRTPATIYYTQANPLPQGVAGQYHPGTDRVVPFGDMGQGRIVLWNPPGKDTAETLRHEYLHKRYFEDLDPLERMRWMLDHRDVAPEWVYQHLENNPVYARDSFQFPNTFNVMPMESYAYAGADPGQLSSDQRNFYYPGVYDDQALRQQEARKAQERMNRWQGEGEQLFSQPIPTDRRQEIETMDPNVRPFTELQTALYYGTPEYNPFPSLGPDSGLTPWGGTWWLGR